jgi:hypothetical protein
MRLIAMLPELRDEFDAASRRLDEARRDGDALYNYIALLKRRVVQAEEHPDDWFPQ